MPHINIKYIPASEVQQEVLTEELTNVITRFFQCSESVVSIALEPIEKKLWNDQVYIPEIMNRKKLLCKFPNY